MYSSLVKNRETDPHVLQSFTTTFLEFTLQPYYKCVVTDVEAKIG